MKKLVSKSVRLSDDIVAFIDAQQGDTFTDKLLNLIDDYQNGPNARYREIKLLDERIEVYRAEIKKYYDTAALARRMNTQYERMLHEYGDDMDRLWRNRSP